MPYKIWDDGQVPPMLGIRLLTGTFILEVPDARGLSNHGGESAPAILAANPTTDMFVHQVQLENPSLSRKPKLHFWTVDRVIFVCVDAQKP